MRLTAGTAAADSEGTGQTNARRKHQMVRLQLEAMAGDFGAVILLLLELSVSGGIGVLVLFLYLSFGLFNKKNSPSLCCVLVTPSPK